MARPIRGAGIAVQGLDELRRELKKLDEAGLTDALKDANQAIAEKVVGWANARASTKMEKAAARTLKASRTQARAQVSFGGAKAEFAEGAEFGAMHDKLRTTRDGQVLGWNQFKQWSGRDRGAGYFLFPSIRAHEPQIVDDYSEAIGDIMSKAFPD